MTDLERVRWEDDPEAFIILRLQESSDPDAAHKAFQAHLKEDAEREEVTNRFIDKCEERAAGFKAELARLREMRDEVSDIARQALDREKVLIVQRDTLLAALRESDDLLRRLSEWDMFWVDPKTGKASVADGRYWQDQIQKARPKNRAAVQGGGGDRRGQLVLRPASPRRE